MTTDLRLISGRLASERDPSASAPLAADEALDCLEAVAWVWDLRTDTLRWSENAARLLGLPDLSRIDTGAGFARLISNRSPQSRDDLLRSADGNTPRRAFSIRYELSLPGGPVAVEDSGVLLGENGRIRRVSGILRRLAPETEAALLGETGLATAARADLVALLAQAYAQAKEKGASFGLIVISISGLAHVEDTSGTEVADQVARELVGRLREEMRRTDRVIRYASNRFALFLAKTDAVGLAATAMRITANLGRRPVTTEAGLVPLSVACGGILGPAFARDPKRLLRRGEEALERARRDGLAYSMYEPDRKQEAAHHKIQSLSDEVIRALGENRLVIARQPVLAAGSRRCAFSEALLRVIRSDGQIVGAGEVIPTFERLGRVEMLDLRVLQLSLQAIAADPALILSVNVSAATLRNRNWLVHLREALQDRPDLARRIIVEMTESQAIEDENVAKRAFTEIRSLGARTAIDDFGAGYTSFRHLRGLDVDMVKIDGGFVQNVGVSVEDGFFVRTLVELARRLGIETVAEWVRDEAAAALLTEWGVDYLQGDCLGKARIMSPIGPGLLADVA
jgi:diguanylate cyclase (GGDEF)-like protein